MLIENYLKLFEQLGEQIIRYRTTRYKGKGRPRNSDFVKLKRKDLRDYQCCEMLENGFNLSYVKENH